MSIQGQHKALHVGHHTESQEAKARRVAKMTGPNNRKWNGGKIRTAEGYILVRKRDHPNANANGRVPEHRLIAEKAMGRYLRPGEVVHHVNRIKDDNRNENLLICTDEYHRWLHRNDGERKESCIRGHLLSGENIYIDKIGRRHCRACRAIRARMFRARALGMIREGVIDVEIYLGE